MEAIVFLALVGVVCLEVHLAFRGWWPVFGSWMERNPICAPVMFLGLLMGPVTGMMAMKSSGKKLGDEAEEIRRGMRR